jgi:integrase
MSGNLYRRGNTWWGRIQVAGREHRRSLRTADRKEAVQRLEKWKQKTIGAARFGIERRTWREAVVKWRADGCAGVKPATAERYLCSIGMVDPIVGQLYLDQIDRGVLGCIAGRRGPTNATKRRDLTAVMAVLYAAEGWGWLDTIPDPRAARRSIRERRDPIRLPTDAEIAALLAACPNDRLRAIVQTMLNTGMRLEEVASLERRQVDFQRGVITLDRTKTSRPRAVPMVGTVVGTLRSLPVRLGCEWLFWHGEGQRFMNLSSRMAGFCRKAKIRVFRRHDLRHRYAVDYLKAGGSVYDLQKILGHSSIKTTEIYLDYLSPEEHLVAKRVGAKTGTEATVVSLAKKV